MNTHTRARALVVGIGVGGVFVACAAGSQSDPAATTGGRVGSALAACQAQPWLGENHTCGATSAVDHRVTCEELGLADAGGRNVLIENFESDTAGFLEAAFAFEDGLRTSLYTQTGVVRPALTTWGLTTNVKDDGTTMTVDALIFSSANASTVYRFDPPEFYVRDMTEAFVTSDIQVCGYRMGQAAGLPPPPPDAGDVTLNCATSTAPAIASVDPIAYTVTITPPPTNGSLIGVEAFVDGNDQGVAFRTLHGGKLAGGYDSELIRPTNGSLELRFVYLGRSCSLFFAVGTVAADGGTSDGGGGQSW